MEERRDTREDQVDEPDDEEGGGEGEGEPDGWEEHHQDHSGPMWQFFQQKGVDKEWGEESSGGDGLKKKVTPRDSTKARGGIGAKGQALTSTTDHYKSWFIDKEAWIMLKLWTNIRGVIVAGR